MFKEGLQLLLTSFKFKAKWILDLLFSLNGLPTFKWFSILGAFGWWRIGNNPYRLCRHFWSQNNHTEVYYGETPLKTYDQIAKWSNLNSKDYLWELGAGCGLGACFLVQKFNCHIVTVEKVPQLVDCGLKLAKLSSKITVIEGNYLKTLPLNASVIWVDLLQSDDHHVKDLCSHLARLKQSPLIITIGQNLSEVDPRYKILKEQEFDFFWGKSNVYLQRFIHQKL